MATHAHVTTGNKTELNFCLFFYYPDKPISRFIARSLLFSLELMEHKSCAPLSFESGTNNIEWNLEWFGMLLTKGAKRTTYESNMVLFEIYFLNLYLKSNILLLFIRWKLEISENMCEYMTIWLCFGYYKSVESRGMQSTVSIDQ